MKSAAVRAEPYANRMRVDEVGGGRVLRMFRSNGRQINVGTYLTREEILAINPANRQSLIGRFIDVWPKAPDTAGHASSATDARLDKPERHVVSLGFNRFKVFEGKWLTEEHVSREDAYKLAGQDAPPVQKMKSKRGKKEH